jgi:hypothetical protein
MDGATAPMPTDPGDPPQRPAALDAALGAALAELADEDLAAVPEAADYRWLGVGLRLGLERPAQARHLLRMIGDPETDRALPADGELRAASLSGDAAEERPDASGPVSVLSALLARAAALPSPDQAGVGPEVTFGWAARLTPREILALGRVVGEMLAAGSPPDVAKGFGLVWGAGVRLPRNQRETMFREFTELEVTVGSVLIGRDLRAEEPRARPRGLGSMLNLLVSHARPEDSMAAAALEGSGEQGRRGLVALWNVWMAMRHRSLIPRPTFDLLVRPWVAVVGPLPED